MSARASLLFLSVPAAAGGAALLAVQVRALLRWLRERVLAHLPFSASVDAGELGAGKVALAIDRPRMKGWNLPTGSGAADAALGRARPRYALVEAATARRIDGRATLVPLVQSGTTRIRYDVATFDVPSAGRFRLEVEGLPAAEPDADVHWVLLRASAPLLFPLRIVGLVAAAGAMIGGIVFTALVLSRAL
jgi:hypothetical protein